MADVACRQLGFPHGTELPMDSVSMFSPDDPESPSLLNWLDRIDCRGPEERLVECDLRRGFLRTPLVRTPVQPNIVVCRQFAVEAALESVVTPGAGTHLKAARNRGLLWSVVQDEMGPRTQLWPRCVLKIMLTTIRTAVEMHEVFARKFYSLAVVCATHENSRVCRHGSGACCVRVERDVSTVCNQQ